MTVRELFLASFYRFKDLKNARLLGFGKVVLYLLALSLFLAIPITTNVLQVFNDVRADGQKIAQKIPDFTIQNGVLTPTEKTEGFIYQTNSIIFTFDPEGKRSTTDISGDMMGNFLSVGLLPDELVVALPSSGLTNQILGSNLLEIPYDQGLTSLDGAHIRTYLAENSVPWWMILITLLVSVYPSFINLVMTILIACIGASLMAAFKGIQVTFFENLKILIFCGTLPVILSALIGVFTLDFDTSLFIILATLFIYSQASKGLPRRQSQV
ncbi:DUF1189 domain-containing protein [Enterococcus sp. AD013-P3]|uniref:DUF1189 domain-containing protein n=1 Tax=Enterococcus sp. AD013-P3 TaxID=3411036 RepID=UPI003B96290D